MDRGAGRESAFHRRNRIERDNTTTKTTTTTTSLEHYTYRINKSAAIEGPAAAAGAANHMMTSGLNVSPGKNEPNHIASMEAPEKTFTLQSLQQPGPRRPKFTRKVPPTLKDERKLFVGGLPPDITSDEFYNFFLHFGAIADSVVMFDRETRKPRGFGFVTFEDASVCDQLLQMGNENDTSSSKPLIGRMEMRGKMMEIKRAQPKVAAPPSNRQPQMYQPQPATYYDNNGAPMSGPPYYQPQEGDLGSQYEPSQQYNGYDQQQLKLPQQQYSTDLDNGQRQQPHNGYTIPPTPPTPSPYYYSMDPSTPVTPQVAFDMAHHMMFYSQLLATPSLMQQQSNTVSPMMASPMVVYGHQPQQYQRYHNAFRNAPIPESANETDLDPPDLQPTLSPRPPAPTCVSPTRKGKPFSIAGATFFPEPSSDNGVASPTCLSPNMRHAKPGLPEKKRTEVDIGGGPAMPF